MFKNNLLSTILTIVLIALVILVLPIMTIITAYINSEALKGFHFSFLIVILLAYSFILLFRTKLFFLPMISFLDVAILWFMFYSMSQGNLYMVPSVSLVLTVSGFNIVMNIP